MPVYLPVFATIQPLKSIRIRLFRLLWQTGSLLNTVNNKSERNWTPQSRLVQNVTSRRSSDHRPPRRVAVDLTVCEEVDLMRVFDEHFTIILPKVRVDKNKQTHIQTSTVNTIPRCAGLSVVWQQRRLSAYVTNETQLSEGNWDHTEWGKVQ